MKEKTNILLITSDQQHWNSLGVMNDEISTPNLDRLAKQGMLFNRAYCPNPTCTPTRASIITGQYPSRHGAWTLGTKLPEDCPTVGEIFIKNDYRTSIIGKAHFQPLASTQEYTSVEAYPILQDLQFWRNSNENFYGFDHYELARNHTNEAHVGQHYAIWLEEKGCENWRDYFLPPTGRMDAKIKHTWNIPEKFHYDAWVSERTNKRLEKHKKDNENFFIWASFPDPHPPYLVPKPWDSMYSPDEITFPKAVCGEHETSPPHIRETQKANPVLNMYNESGYYVHGFHSHVHDEKSLRKDIAVYYGMISLMDKYIGRILDKLDELGLSDSTLVVFTSDHGHFFGHHGLIAKGAFHYEDMIKVPLIVRCPDKIPAGTSSESMQSLVDFAPTFLSFTDMEIPAIMTGKDQRLVWCGEAESVRDHIICENHHEPTSVNLRTYVNKRYKITVYYNRTYGELYDLHSDPEEIENLWDNADYSDLKSELLLKLIWGELEKEPMWMPRISGA